MSSDDQRKTLKSIPTGRFARGLKMASLTASVGASALGDKLGGLLGTRAEKEANRLMSQVRQAKKIATVLGQMKGAAMKLGQVLSIHGEHLFPKEVTEVLAMLQNQSATMDFSEIEKVLKAELGPKLDAELFAVSREPIAAASIGQVHEAFYRPKGAKEPLRVAVKVQYPGVDKSIDSDVDSMASLLGVLTRFPNMEGFNAVTDEIKTILRQETDYLAEGRNLVEFGARFKNEPHIVVPRFIPEVSTKRVLVTELMTGLSVQQFAESTASLAARDFIAEKFFEVFYAEMFGMGKVQTDPNFANYKIQWRFGVDAPTLVLLDFGAVKEFDEPFRRTYARMIRACLDDDYEGIRSCAIEIGFLREDDPESLVKLHYELVKLCCEPFFTDAPFDWAGTDIAERVRRMIPRFVLEFKLRPPPKDFIFLDRKVVGVFFFCSAIRASYNPKRLIGSHISKLLSTK